jgi:16S rRNA (uracil1498-N3)-methyltransferase
MTRRRWIADEYSEDRAALVGAHAEHLAVVLRVRAGQSFEIVTGEKARLGRVTAISPQRVEFELGEDVVGGELPRINLLMAIYKFDRMEWAIEKCTELGVARMIPVIARRTDPHLARAAAARVDRWQRVVRQAAEQSRRPTTPTVDLPVKLADIINLPAPTRILLAESAREITLKDALNHHAPGGELLLALGPEGGWSDDEVALFGKNGWVAATLGATILRAETAAIAATAIALAELS